MTKATASPKAWAVLAGMVLIQAVMMGVIINCTGIVFSAVLEDCGFRAGDLSVYYTIRSLASAAAVGVTSRLFFRYGGKAVMAALGAILALSFGSMYFFDSLWQWYLSWAPHCAPWPLCLRDGCSATLPAARHRHPPPWNRRPEPLPFPPIFLLANSTAKAAGAFRPGRPPLLSFYGIMDHASSSGSCVSGGGRSPGSSIWVMR